MQRQRDAHELANHAPQRQRVVAVKVVRQRVHVMHAARAHADRHVQIAEVKAAVARAQQRVVAVAHGEELVEESIVEGI